MGKRTWSTERAGALAEARGGELLSPECRTWDDRLRWRCEHGHEWEAVAYAIGRGQWCPWCSGLRCEIDTEAQRKRCSWCGTVKPFAEFVRDKRKKHGITPDCKTCRNARGRRWREANPEKVRAYSTAEAARAWREANPEAARACGRRWREKNRDKIAAAARRRRREDPNSRVKSNLRGRLNDALKRGRAEKQRPICELIGCTIAELRAHLEAQFAPGMSWENYGRGRGKWHIDHIRPCASFDLTDPAQQAECFHHLNLQPLWAVDNFRKGAREVVQ